MLSIKTIPSPSQTKRSKGNTAQIEIAHRFYDGRFAYHKRDAVLLYYLAQILVTEIKHPLA
jgi:hypothetical protein